jgi:ent-kaurenoic acid hydroxylase
VTERRNQRKQNILSNKKDMLDNLLNVKDEDGKTLDDEEIIDVLLMYLNAGHESSGHTIMWATVFLQEHPEVLQRAKVSGEKKNDFISLSSSYTFLCFAYDGTIG